MLSPCSKNPSWQPFTICFSNSFPASFAWTLLFSLAGFLSPSQTSWSLIYLCFCLQRPARPDPASSPSQGCTSSRKCPWQHSIPQGALPPLSIAYIVFPTQQLLVPRIVIFQNTIWSPCLFCKLLAGNSSVSCFFNMLCCVLPYSSHSPYMALEHWKCSSSSWEVLNWSKKYTGLQRLSTKEWINCFLN